MNTKFYSAVVAIICAIPFWNCSGDEPTNIKNGNTSEISNNIENLNTHLPLITDQTALDKYHEGPIMDGQTIFSGNITPTVSPTDTRHIEFPRDLYIVPANGGEYQLELFKENAEITGIRICDDFNPEDIEKTKQDEADGIDYRYRADKLISLYESKSTSVKYDFREESLDESLFGKIGETIVLKEQQWGYYSPTVGEEHIVYKNLNKFTFPTNKTGKDRLIVVYIHALYAPVMLGDATWEDYSRQFEYSIAFLQKG